MRIDIVTIFPEMFNGPFNESILKRAIENGILEVHIHNLRDFTNDRHKVVDDYPFGGGVGMVMKPEPFFAAVEHVRTQVGEIASRVILMCPQGEVFSQKKAQELSHQEHLLFLCGHYEGIDERVRENLVTDEISIGDYVLTGGELPAMVVIDAMSRMIPGVLGKDASAKEDSFYNGLLEYPQYTRPRSFRGYNIPDILLSGNHELIHKWRLKESLRRTLSRRPDLLAKKELTPEEKNLLKAILQENEEDQKNS